MRWEYTHEWGAGEDLEGDNNGLFEDTIPA